MEVFKKGPLLESNHLLKTCEDSKTTILAFKGDMGQTSSQLLVHAKKPINKDTNINYIFTWINDPDFQLLVSLDFI